MRSWWSRRTPSLVEGAGHRPQELVFLAALLAFARPDALGRVVEAVEADRHLGVEALPVPDHEDAVADAHVPVAPVAVPRAHLHPVGTVALLQLGGGRQQPAAVRLAGQPLGVRAQPDPEAAVGQRSLAAAGRGGPPRACAASRAAGLTRCRGLVVRVTSRAPRARPTARDGVPRGPGTSAARRAPTDGQGLGLAAHQRGGEVVVTDLGEAPEPASEVEDLEHRLLVDPAGAEEDADADLGAEARPRGGSRSSRRPVVGGTRSIGQR